MYFVFKYQIICFLIMFLLLLNNSSSIRTLVILENIWVCFFSLLCYLDIYIDDTLFLCLAFLCLLLAACEIVTLISMYILDYSK